MIFRPRVFNVFRVSPRFFQSIQQSRTGPTFESVIGRIVAAQREELEREIGELEVEAGKIAEEARELVGDVPF